MLKITPTRDNRFVVLEDFSTHGVLVPKGYKTNGANIPRFLWSVVPPFKPKFLLAVVVHDYLTDKELYKRADDKFESILYEIENSFITRMMVRTVRAYHAIRY